MEEVWLDRLPLGVCENIARYVAKLESPKSALQLARCSAKQKSALVAALDYTYTWTSRESGQVDWDNKEWAGLFNSCVRTVKAASMDAPDEIMVPLLQSPTLRSAQIDDKPAFLEALCATSSIRELSVWVEDSLDDVLLDALKELNITKLSLSMWCHDPNQFEDMCEDIGYDFLSSRCPQLKSLDLRFPYGGYPSEALLQVIDGLTALQELGINDGRLVSEVVLVDRLRKIDRMRVVVRDELDFALAVRTSVIDLWLPTLDDADVLLQFPQLEKLRIGIEANYDERRYHELATVFAQMPTLKDLSLQWLPREGEEFIRVSSRTPAAASSTNLLTLIDALPNLESLLLSCDLYSHVSENELMTVLRKVGSRLKYFDAPFWQHTYAHGTASERLFRLLMTIAGHNSGLEKAVIWGTWLDTDIASQADEVNKEQRSRIRSAQTLISRHVPNLSGEFVIEAAEIACKSLFQMRGARVKIVLAEVLKSAFA